MQQHSNGDSTGFTMGMYIYIYLPMEHVIWRYHENIILPTVLPSNLPTENGDIMGTEKEKQLDHMGVAHNGE
jgi:hypothetical protein